MAWLCIVARDGTLRVLHAHIRHEGTALHRA